MSLRFVHLLIRDSLGKDDFKQDRMLVLPDNVRTLDEIKAYVTERAKSRYGTTHALTHDGNLIEL
jgi:hypothetical protein